MAQSVVEITSTLRSTIVFGKTNAEVRENLEWLMANENLVPPEGLTAAALNQWLLDKAHEKIWLLVMNEIRRNRLRDKKIVAEQDALSAAAATIIAERQLLLAETALIPEPEPPPMIIVPE